MPSSKNSNGSSGQVSNRLRSFFRISSVSSPGNDKNGQASGAAGAASGSGSGDGASPKPFRHTKFFSNTVGRLRAHTVASEGNQIEEAMSPTAHANPYFAHQGQPGLRHHNAGSVPPSPPDTPSLHIAGPDGVPSDQATLETKEELARRLRRVASAPNAQGMFNSADGKGGSGGAGPDSDRPATAELGKDPLIENTGSLGLMDAKAAASGGKTKSADLQSEDVLASLPAPHSSLAFRRTYSSTSIKVRNVEVGPASFDKIKLIGKGDVGKVYLVREKKSSRLYAMKGMLCAPDPGRHLRCAHLGLERPY